ncbi:Autophagy-related 27 [Hyphodiscus hymeniophilus]|uniref:Autophagy-related protein 27 n=1 Tax=Hyphodiscus hymeniophilus TaxID=353542 RepID=A0A9P6VJT8_9HELO|nr:Autophagy-related 27 [Hyphodiscus hymeniophilus]
MRLAQNAAVISTLLFPLLSAAAGSFSCEHIRVNKQSFNLKPLGGAKSVMHHFENHNTTYTVDICKALGKVKDIPAEEQCPNGTQHGNDVLDEVYPIAGELKEKGGGHMEPKWERLKDSTSHEDSTKEGLRVSMNGGFRKLEGGKNRGQKAIIEFVCDKNREGTEHLYDPEDKYTEEKVKRDEDDGDDAKEDPDSPSLQFVRYEEGEGDVDTLRLRWLTKWACEGAKDEQDADKAGHWGFFTWFILIAFFSTATYLIFGSWLNYNRYGARGWDLLPHGDTIRDVPYLFKDWMRRVLSTIQGGGSRGGYAAV